MASPLAPELKASYSVIIDDILAVSDLNTISAKRIRKGLQDKIGYDITHQKQSITDLIMERFDKYQRDHPNAIAETTVTPPVPTTTNGVHHYDSNPSIDHTPNPHKRKANVSEVDDGGEHSDVLDSPPEKKMKKTPNHESDEQMAKRMQEELNREAARATRRGGAAKRKPPVKKEKKPKKKSAAKVHSDDDSDIDSSAVDKPEKEKKGGFHKLMNLSPSLQALLGETQLSRPQTVKRIWAYVRERDLQQPDDRRNILCDDALRAVFKADKIHMFTMNKVLATQLYPADEV